MPCCPSFCQRNADRQRNFAARRTHYLPYAYPYAIRINPIGALIYAGIGRQGNAIHYAAFNGYMRGAPGTNQVLPLNILTGIINRIAGNKDDSGEK
jgi:hypothetical protein